MAKTKARSADSWAFDSVSILHVADWIQLDGRGGAERPVLCRPAHVRSRAEQEAEQKVALSPDKIIDLLRQEPGLLLQVKKMLVRKAYEQGRILDPEDLTDDSLFELLREDHEICVLATREIEDRESDLDRPFCFRVVLVIASLW